MVAENKNTDGERTNDIHNLLLLLSPKANSVHSTRQNSVVRHRVSCMLLIEVVCDFR